MSYLCEQSIFECNCRENELMRCLRVDGISEVCMSLLYYSGVSMILLGVVYDGRIAEMTCEFGSWHKKQDSSSALCRHVRD